MIDLAKTLYHSPVFISSMTVLICSCYYYLESNSQTFRKFVWSILSSVFIGTLIIFAGSAIYRIQQPQVWDYTAFYLYGKTAVNGLNFYSPESFRLIYDTLKLPFAPEEMEGFVEEVVQVGFLYPPQTILLFIPLGFFSFKSGLIIWTIFNLLIVCACIYLLHSLFLKHSGFKGLMFISSLLFILSPAISTINFGQTNFIILLFLLLMKKYSEVGYSGIFWAIAMFTKPYIAILFLFFVAQKNMKAIIYGIASVALITGVTLRMVGWETFQSYMFDNAAQRLPDRIFSADVNQSLHGILLRNGLISLNENPSYLFIILTIIGLTLTYIYFLYKSKSFEHIFSILLLIGLIIYPGTLWYYGTVLLFIIFQLFTPEPPQGLDKKYSIFIVALFYFFSTFSVFLSILLLLFVVMIKSFPDNIRKKVIGG